ncbi:MAG: hypothetical protein PHO76_07835 [Methylotenera sp.]|nr:hypothetical protein [Methylotenera sp.]MDD4924907.1 hypothetical protein [Methylotenera sp.]
MSLKAEDILQVLTRLLDGSIVDTPLGRGFSISPRDAFLFSAITGASYFENQIYPFTPKGLLKVFYNALDYNFVTGIFDNTLLRNTPTYITQQRQYLLHGNKTIVPLEINSERDFKDQLKSKYGISKSDNNLVILRIDLSKKGYGLEPFMEYLACKFFGLQGYITENQIPLSHALGSPDFGGFGIDKIQSEMLKLNLLPKGFNVLELSMLRTFPNTIIQNNPNNNNSNFIVGEAKTSTTNMDLQIRKYLSSGFFNEALEIHPTKSEASKSDIAILTIENHSVIYKTPETSTNFSNTKNKTVYQQWLESYLNCYVLSNYENDELNLVCVLLLHKKLEHKDDLVRLIRDFDFYTHINILKRFLNDGSIK